VAGSNSGDTNIFITTSSIVSDTNHSIDAATNTIETATISITAEKHIPEATPFPATVTKCSINYRPTEAGSPVLSDLTIRPDCPLLEGENTCEVVLIDFQRKQEFLTDSTHDPKIPTKYVAEYRCDYQNAGGAGNFPVKYDVWLADFTLPSLWTYSLIRPLSTQTEGRSRLVSREASCRMSCPWRTLVAWLRFPSMPPITALP